MTRTRKILLALFATLLLLAGATVVVPPILFGDGVDYSSVTSIEATPDYQNPALLEKAWALPVAALYRKHLDFQSNGSFCGPTSVVNVMRSLDLDASQQTVLQDTEVSTILGILPGGLTLDTLADVARKKLHRRVTVLRDLDLPTFREHLKNTNDLTRRYIVNFSRGPLFGHGGGHHSPIGGYLVDEDLVFVIDVNSKYRPWLVKPERLLEAMNTSDKGAKKKRGMIVIE